MDRRTDKVVLRYKCREDKKPHRLYRVQYYGSTSLTARCEPSFPSKNEFKADVKNHLIWGYRHPTPFVSTFANRQHANNWANQHARHARNVGGGDMTILELNPSLLGPIFCVRRLVKRHGVKTKLPERMYEDEYLILQRIRNRSIVGREVVHTNENYDSDDPDLDESGDSESGDSESDDSESGDSESDDSERDDSEIDDSERDDSERDDSESDDHESESGDSKSDDSESGDPDLNQSDDLDDMPQTFHRLGL